MKTIPLTHGKVALVDDEDYERLRIFKWRIMDRGGKYAIRCLPRSMGTRKNLLMHREILGAATGQYIDHVNHDTLDNQKANLRFCTITENGMNRIKQNRKSSSRFKGVYWQRKDKRWRATIRHLTKLISLGEFRTEEEAALAYDKKAREVFGEFALLNFPSQE